MSSKNFLLSAYVDHNVGDDLFILYFCKRYSECLVWLLCDSDFNLNSELESLPNLRRINLKSAVKRMHVMDAFVMLGGSIFQDNPLFYRYDYQRNILVTWAKLFRAKVFIMGCNIGPIRSARGKRIFKYCMALADGISVRDAFSLKLLRDWGLEKKSICAPDLIFSYSLPDVAARYPYRLGVSVIKRGGDAEVDAYVRGLTAIIGSFLSKQKVREVRLYAFDGGQENDSSVAEFVMAKLSPDERIRVSICRYTTIMPLSQFVSDFGSCGYIIGTRFHSIVLALRYGIKCMPIIYSEKTSNQLEDLSFRGIQSFYSSIHDFDPELIEADISQATDCFQLAHAIGESALLHFSYLDRFVEKW